MSVRRLLLWLAENCVSVGLTESCVFQPRLERDAEQSAAAVVMWREAASGRGSSVLVRASVRPERCGLSARPRDAALELSFGSGNRLLI